jgi:hypothetical protein
MDDPRGDKSYLKLQTSIAKAVRLFGEKHRRVDDILVARTPESRKGFTVAASIASEADLADPGRDLSTLELAIAEAIRLFEEEADPWWVGGFRIGVEGFIPRVTKETQWETIHLWWSGAWERVG